MVEETFLFTDDAELLADLIRNEWSLEPGKEPSIAYDVRAQIMSSRYASVFVYMISRSSDIATVDYRTLHRISYLGIKITAPFRNNLIEVCQEVERILMAHRRAGKRRLGGYTYLEMTSERFVNDLSGFYSCTIDVRMTSYHTPLHSAGMGSPVNEMVDERMHHPDDSISGKEFMDLCQE